MDLEEKLEAQEKETAAAKKMVESTNGQIQTLKKDGEALRGQIDNTLEEVQKALAELAPDQKMAEARSELHDALCKLKEDSLDQLEALESIPMVRCPPDSSPWKRRSRLDQLDQWDSQKMELEKEQKERERRIEQDREICLLYTSPSPRD